MTFGGGPTSRDLEAIIAEALNRPLPLRQRIAHGAARITRLFSGTQGNHRRKANVSDQPTTPDTDEPIPAPEPTPDPVPAPKPPTSPQPGGYWGGI